MSQNLKIQRSPKEILWKMLLSNCTIKFIFPFALAVEGSALGLILFSFSLCLLFHDARKK